MASWCVCLRVCYCERRAHMCVDMLMYHCECTLLVARPKVAGCAYGVYACVHVCAIASGRSPRAQEETKISRAISEL